MFEIVFGLFGGLAVFIFALKSMSDGLQKLAGKKAHRVMEVLTSIPVVGVLVGAAVTAVVGSSTLVTVMVVGFVNASMMTLKQAISVIMGANIGTTVTAQLVAFRITDLWPFFAAFGFLVYFVFRRKRIKTVGSVVFALGLLLLGMVLMSQAMHPLRDNPVFANLMLTLSHNRILALLVGFLFTALIQSSTAATGVIVAMAMQGLIPLEAALPMILGTNVGTCITALFASIGTSLSARRAAVSHMTFNALGALLFLILLPQFESLVLAVSPANDLPRQVANAHTLFSVINTLLFLPFITPFTKLITLMVPGEETALPRGPIYLASNLVTSPSFAIKQAQKELLRMADFAGQNVQLAMEAFLERDEKKVKQVREQETVIDELEQAISHYLSQVSQSGMDDATSIRHTGLLHAANDLERISDHAEDIAELAQKSIDEKISFSDEGIEELKEMYGMVEEAFQTAVQSIRSEDPSLVPKVKAMEEQIDAREKALRTAHISRLKEGRCTADSGTVFLALINHFERIGDHADNLSDLPLGKL